MMKYFTCMIIKILININFKMQILKSEMLQNSDLILLAFLKYASMVLIINIIVYDL